MARLMSSLVVNDSPTSRGELALRGAVTSPLSGLAHLVGLAVGSDDVVSDPRTLGSCTVLSPSERDVIRDGTYSGDGLDCVLGTTSSRRLATCCLLACIASACAPSDPHSGLGLIDDDRGLPRLRYLNCTGESVESIHLLTADGRTLWSVKRDDRAQGLSVVQSAQLGVAIPGWRTLVPLTTPLTPDQRLVVTVTTTTREPGDLSFDQAGLRHDRWYSDSGLVSEAEYLAQRDYC